MRLPSRGDIRLGPAGPVQRGVPGGWAAGLLLALAVTGLVLLAAFAVANSVLRSAAQRRLGQARAMARVAQSAPLREVPETVAAARLDSVAATSFRDPYAQPGLSLGEVARVTDLSVTRAAGEKDFVTAVFAELDPGGWVQLVVCGHPPPLRLAADGELESLAPAVFATPLGLHPELHLSTFSVRTGDRLLFFTDGLLEARGRAGRFFRLAEQAGALGRRGLQEAVDELLDRLRAHTRNRLDDDVAVLLAELILTGPESGPAPPASGGRPGLDGLS